MDINEMIHDYTNWLNSGFSATNVGEYFELSTPYLDRFNDHLQIYIKQDANGIFHLTDNGYVIQNLASSGFSFSRSPKRKEMLCRVARNFGITLNGDALEVKASKADYPQKKHMLLQTMMAVDDMYIAQPATVKNFFAEDVGTFLDANDIYYSRDFSIMGKTGSIYVYDYHLQRTKNTPERFCKAINHVTTSTRNLTLFNWVDTIEKRPDKSELIVFLNDAEDIENSDIDAFNTYGVNCIRWSERNRKENIKLLAQ